MANSTNPSISLCGVLVVDKPLGWTSMDVIRRIRRSTGQRKLKAGHAGTLDPLATGILVCCIGTATKQIDRLMASFKEYEAVVDLSAFTETDDRQGQRHEVAIPTPPTQSQIEQALPPFIGEIQQIPPAFSAIHVQGKRSYDLARKGHAVALGARSVRVDGIQIMSYQWPELALRVQTGKGVYIRSLARDIGQALGTGGHLASLRRTRVGPFSFEFAMPGAMLEQKQLTQADLLDLPQAMAMLSPHVG